MFTENWPLAHDPTWPPPAHLIDPAPIVYLDQWCYVALAQDRAGKLSQGHDAAGTYKRLRDLTLDRKAIIVLSRAHYAENWQRTNLDARWDTAVAMGELTGFNSITAAGLDDWEATMALHEVLEVGSAPTKPEPVGWGWGHAHIGQTIPARIVSDAKVDWTAVEIKLLSEIERTAAFRLELAMLARWDPALALTMDSWPYEDPSTDGFSTKFADQEERYRTQFEQHNLSTTQLTATLGLLAIQAALPNLVAAGASLGLEDGFLVHVFEESTVAAEAGEPWGSTTLAAILDAMPILGPYTALRTGSFTKDGWTHRPGDFFDFFTLATVAPFVDFVVCDRRTFNLAKDSKLSSRTGYSGVERKLSFLCDELEGRATAR